MSWWRDGVLVVAALTNDERDASEVESPTCEESPGSMSAAEIRALMERAQKDNPPPDTTGWIATPTPRGRPFAVMRIEDDVDAVRVVARQGPPAGAEVSFERVGETPRLFLRFAPGAKEKDADVLARARTVVATMKHPPKTFFALEQMHKTEDRSADGYRTFLMRDEVVIDERDIAKAAPTMDGEDMLVAIDLKPEGAKRLEALTKETSERRGRIALLVDGIVVMTPLATGVSKAGRLEIWVPPDGTPAKRRANAERLAKALVRR